MDDGTADHSLTGADNRLMRSSRTTAVLMMAFGQTVVWTTLFYVFPAMILQWEAAHAWTKAELTGAITLALLLSAVASPWVGRQIDQGKGPLTLTLGASVGALCLFCVSWVNALWQFYLLWVCMGVALAACLYEPCFMLVTRAYGSSAKRSIIAITLIAGFASTISFPAAYFISAAYGWKAVTIIFSVTALLVGAPLLYAGAVILENHAASARRSIVPAAQLKLLSNPLVVRLGLCFALLAIVHGATLQHLLPILRDRHLSPGDAVLIASMIGPMQVAGRLVMTAVQAKVSHAMIAMSCFFFIGLSMCLLYLSGQDLMVALWFAVLFGGSYGVVSIIRPVIARDILGDENFGAKSGSLAFFFLVGSALAPYIGALIWNIGGYDLLIPMLAVVALTGLVALRRVVATVP